MIVRARPSGLRLFLVTRGSILPSIWNSLIVPPLLAVVITWTDGALWHHKITLASIPFTLMGLPLDALCRTIEIDLRESLGDDDIPAPLAPTGYCLN